MSSSYHELFMCVQEVDLERRGPNGSHSFSSLNSSLASAAAAGAGASASPALKKDEKVLFLPPPSASYGLH
jgi:hypothetical protein